MRSIRMKLRDSPRNIGPEGDAIKIFAVNGHGYLSRLCSLPARYRINLIRHANSKEKKDNNFINAICHVRNVTCKILAERRVSLSKSNVM